MAYEAWEQLKQNFETPSKDQFKIRTGFFAFIWTSGKDITKHIAKFGGLSSKE